MTGKRAATRRPQGAAPPVTIIGAGLAGTLLSILLSRRGYRIRLYERLPDLREASITAGRSINLALAARGIGALKQAGVMPAVEPLMIAMQGRVLHDVDGTLTRIPYGQRAGEVIYSISRRGLNQVLLDAAATAGVEILFRHSVVAARFDTHVVRIRDENSGHELDLPMHRIIGADGAGSVLRRSLTSALNIPCTEDLLEHGYKELTLPAGDTGAHQIDRHALHIWPRGDFMLIALPNLDGSFTATLFLPQTGEESFATLRHAEHVDDFFARHFPDIRALMPQLAAEFLAHPVGVMGTVRCAQWSVEDRLLLLGDAAHAITPFHGQGMNCAFEDCAELAQVLQHTTDWKLAFIRFQQARHPNTDAIADMALENYLEMRDTVREPEFQLQKALSLELERRHPHRFVPRYSMVMFHEEIPYAVALARGEVQDELLAELTRDAVSLADVDFQRAARLIQARLPSLN